MYLYGSGKNEFSFFRMRYKLNKDEVVVGRGKINDINISLIVLSQKQFLLKNLGDYWEITNLSNTNGTILNNIPLPVNESRRININDIISIGNDGICQLTFTDEFNYLKLKEIHNMQNNDLILNINKRNSESYLSLEDYLRCQICREFFIKPVLTNCGHTFCQSCLNRWSLMTRFGGDSCPLCQHKVEYTSRNIIVESCVEALLKQLPPEHTTEWKKSTEERNPKKRKIRSKKM